MPPKPRHKETPHPRHKPLKHKKKGNTGKLWASVIVGFGITVFVAVVMATFAIPVSVLLPTCAPILVGAITLAYMVQKD